MKMKKYLTFPIKKTLLIICICWMSAGFSLLKAQEGLPQQGLPPGISDSWEATDALDRQLVTWDKAGIPWQV